MQDKLEQLVKQAQAGNRKALEQVLEHIRDLVYNLSLKMLLFPEDAADATQEILVRVLTRLSTFKRESRFTTWVYRVATNFLLTEKKKHVPGLVVTMEEYGRLIDSGQSTEVRHAQNQGELLLLEEEVKVSCTLGLLQCLNEQGRMVYILGELLEFNSLEGAAILEISSENFRKILSRSRTRIRNFLQKKCGLANPDNPCRCTRKIDTLIDRGLIAPTQLRFAPHTGRSIDLISQIDHLEKSAAIYRSMPQFTAPEEVVSGMKSVLEKLQG